MLEIITKTFQQISALWEMRGPFVELCQHHPFLAAVVIFLLIVVVTYILLTNLLELLRKFAHWMHSTRGRVGMGIGFCVVSLLSAATVMFINAASAPAPVFASDLETLLIGEPVRLKWSFAAADGSGPVLYEMESAEDIDFKINVEKEGYAEGGYKPIKHPINAARFWRVRAVVAGDEHRPISRWSRGVRVEQYESAYKRIATTGTFSVYVSNSVEQGIFKFLSDNDGKLNGYDIRLAQALAAGLPAKMGINGPLRLKFTPVSWQELLKSPGDGRADMIISTITKREKREEDFKIKFSDSYYSTTQSLIYRCGEADRPIKERLRGRRIGVQEGTTSQDLLNLLRSDMGEQAIIMQRFAQAEEIIAALLRPVSNIDYGLTDTPFAIGAELQNRHNGFPSLGYKQFTSADFPASTTPEQQVEEYAVAVRSADVLLMKAINEILSEMKERGELASLLQQETKQYELSIRPQGVAGSAARC
jgi:ABC-type amino acid transport substrate-binding protein